MRTKIFQYKTVFAGMILLVTSCTTTKVISSWSISNPPPGALDKVLVLGVMIDREAKDQIEQAMSASLNSSGINASPAMSIFGPKRFRDLKENEVVDKLHSSDFSAVLIVSLVNKEKETEYVPGTYIAPYPGPGYYRFYRRYWYIYDGMYTPGYYRTTTNWVLEADIYTIDGDELIYSTQTRSYDPNDAKDLAESFTRSIVAELKTKGFISK